MTLAVSIVHFVIPVPKLVQMIATIYRVQVYHSQSNMAAKNPRWQPRNLVLLTFEYYAKDKTYSEVGKNWLRNGRQKSKMAATKFSFFEISTSDRGDFPRIIEIALFYYCFVLNNNILIAINSLHKIKKHRAMNAFQANYPYCLEIFVYCYK